MKTMRLGLLVLLAACNTVDAGESTAVVMDTIGDTIVAQSRGAGVWGTGELGVQRDLMIGALEGDEVYTFGSIGGVALAPDGTLYVLDEQVPVVRRYDETGAHIGSFGRAGGGPGELKQANGIAVLSDGRVLVRDPGNARMNVYSPEGESLTTWSIPGGYFTSEPVHVDTAGYIYIDVIASRRDDGTWRLGLLRLNDEGEVLDTLLRPFSDYDVATLKAQRITKQGNSFSFTSVPFLPTPQVAFSPFGMYVGGITDRYAITAFRPDGSFYQITRDYERVPVDPGERATEIERVTRNMRRTDAAWKWNGPSAGTEKPPFRGLRAARDGRIWVQVAAPAENLGPDPDAEPDPNGLPALDRWRQPALYDVFEPDGVYLGRVRMPERFTMYVIEGERVCGVQRDELGVEYVACYRVTKQAQPA